MIRVNLREPVIAPGLPSSALNMGVVTLNRPFLVSYGEPDPEGDGVYVCLPCYAHLAGGDTSIAMVPMFPVRNPPEANYTVGYEFVNTLEARYRFLRYLREDEYVGFSGRST